MREIIPFDVETTTINKGNPYNNNNKLVAVGLANTLYYKEFNVKEIQATVDSSILVGHNIKFDIAWLRNIGIDFSNAIVRDTQLTEFLLSNQTHQYASLNELALQYLNEQKIDIVKEEYWNKGIDTWFIPENILLEYLQKDLDLTLKVFKIQERRLKDEGKWNLYLLQCADLLVLQEMEHNGILFEKEKAIYEGELLQNKLDDLKRYILSYTNYPGFNIDSGDHLSCLLYGGTILHTDRIPIGVYKTGEKVGLPRYKKFLVEYPHKGLIAPLKGSELKKEGYYSTSEDVLRSLKPKIKEIKKLLDSILEYSKLFKLQSTYYFGIPKKIDEFGWTDNYIHSQLNQVVARTGRLSSSEPNQQNFDPKLKQLCISRYD